MLILKKQQKGRGDAPMAPDDPKAAQLSFGDHFFDCGVIVEVRHFHSSCDQCGKKYAVLCV
jgi:hypothetical protein